jgi:alkylation response protein AidB-like acyl-CoA dehydrogenase
MITAFDSSLSAFEELAREFAAGELKPDVEAHDRYPFAPLFDDAIGKAWAAGFFGVVLPEALGGIGGDIDVLCTLLERISQTDASLAGIMLTTAMAQSVLLSAQVGELIDAGQSPAQMAHDVLFAFPAFCNPGQMVSLPTAKVLGSMATLDGGLEYLTLGGLAARALVPARADNEGSYSWFLVKLKDAGVSVSEPIFSLGLHACPSVDVQFAGTRAILIGSSGGGDALFSNIRVRMQLAAASMAAGIMKGALDEALAYTRERAQGGRKIIDWSEVRMIFANMAIKSRVADLCLTQACSAVTADSAECREYAAAAALHVQELACEVVTDGVQLLGGNGYMKDYPQEKRYRDARQVQALLGLAPLKKLELSQALIARATQ